MIRFLTLFFFIAILFKPQAVLAQDPGYMGFTPLRFYPCSSTTNPEFHPLRPYPASPCDPYILRKLPEATANLPSKEFNTFSCNNTLNTTGTFQVYDFVCDNINAFPGDCVTSGLDIVPANLSGIARNPSDLSYYYNCGSSVCLVHQTYINFTVDLSQTRLPIIGNSEAPMGDLLLTNTYLDWYLNGSIQHAEWNRARMNPDNPVSRNRIVTYSGPLLKQLPRSFANDIRTSLRGTVRNQIHNYQVGNSVLGGRVSSTPADRFFMIPLTTQEDTTSEITVGLPTAQPPGDGEIITWCRDVRAFEIALGRDPSDSRIYIPKVRSDDALSDTLASLSRPYPTGTVSSNNSDLFSRRIDQHQGASDGVPVQTADYLTGSNTRNTEINASPLVSAVAFPNRYRAPEPITPLLPNPECQLPNALTSPGDKVMGSSQYNSTLIYYQHFQYTPQYRASCTGCGFPGDGCNTASDCCWSQGECEEYDSGSCSGQGGSCIPYYSACPGFDNGEMDCGSMWHCCGSLTPPRRCAQWPVRNLNSPAQVGVYTKTPLVERIYDTLVVGRSSVLRRFAPARPALWPRREYIMGEVQIENTIPGASTTNYVGNTESLTAFMVSGGDGFLPYDVYYDRLGSLSDHFLGDRTSERLNLQKLLRPYRPEPTPTGGPELGVCSANCDPNVPDQGYSCVNRASYIDLAQRWPSGTVFPNPNAACCYNATVQFANDQGLNPGIFLLIWMNESGASKYEYYSHPIEDFGIHTGAYNTPNNWSVQIQGLAVQLNTIRTQCAAELAAGVSPLEVFASRFVTTHCRYQDISTDPAVAGLWTRQRTMDYATNILFAWNSLIQGCAPFPFP